jgi:hypothetical protein
MNKDQDTANESVSEERKPNHLWIYWFLALVGGTLLWMFVLVVLSFNPAYASLFYPINEAFLCGLLYYAPIVFATCSLAVWGTYRLTRQISGALRHLIVIMVAVLTYLINGVVYSLVHFG